MIYKSHSELSPGTEPEHPAHPGQGAALCPPAPVCHSLLPSTSVPISAPCCVLQWCGQCWSEVFSYPFLGINWSGSPTELHLRSQPAEVQTLGPVLWVEVGTVPPGLLLVVGNAQVSEFSHAFPSCASPTTAFSYRKAPPPIPPGTKAKPLISVTAQSSTESTHDSYLPSEVARSPAWSKDAAARCNSAESLESSKVTTVTLDLPPVQPRAAPKPSTLIIKAIPGREELRSLARQRKWRPSIGVQVGVAAPSVLQAGSDPA